MAIAKDKSEKIRIFVSFSPDDTDQVDRFMRLQSISDGFAFYNHRRDDRINSRDRVFVGRVVRDEYIKPSFVTVVLIGNKTAQSASVKWEIAQSRREGKGILGIRLPGTRGAIPDGIPPRHVGGWAPKRFPDWIKWAFQNREE